MSQAAQAQATSQVDPQKSVGRMIRKLEGDIKKLDQEEKQIKHKMQDRKKFISAKNAYTGDQKLEAICQEKDRIRAEIRSLQG